MTRILKIAAAQLGPIHRADTRAQVVERLIAMLREADGAGCRLVVFPELALTTFFPRYWVEDQAEIDAFFETAMPNPATQPLFDEAARLGVGFYLGYAELTDDGTPFFNASIAGEYIVMKNLGLSDDQLISLTRNAIEYAFCDKDTKRKLLAKI